MKYLFSVLLICVISVSNAQEKHTIAAIPTNLTKNANSVLIDQIITIDVTDASKLLYKNHTVRAVLNKSGDKHVRKSVSFDKETKVKKIEAYVYDAFGNELKHFKKRDFQDVSVSDGVSIYNDSRVYRFNYTPTTYPYFVVFDSEIESQSTAFIPNWIPVRAYASSTKSSKYTIRFDPLNKPRYLAENLEGLNIKLTENPTEIICSATNIEAFKYEELSPSFVKITPVVYFALNSFTLKGVKGYAENWQQFGEWMQKSLLNDVNELPEMTVVEIKRLVENETTNQAKARIVYDYLQKKVRYISVQIGIGGWKPMLAEDVDKLSYGDCKALSNYTKALLDAVNVPSYYTILHSYNYPVDIDENFSMFQGNHAILAIPEGDEFTWLECTSQNTPFGYIGRNNADRAVLIVTPEGGKIVRTREYSYLDNLQQSNIVLKIHKDGSAKATFNRFSKGTQYGDKFRVSTKSDEDIRKRYKNSWGNINGYAIESLKLDNNRDAIIFTEDLVINIPKYCTKIGEDFLFNPNVFNINSYLPSRIKDRKNPMVIDEGYTDIDEVEIIIPEGYKVEELPEPKTIENKFGSYTINFEMTSENIMLYSRQIIIKKGAFPKEEYSNYRAFRKKISKLDKTKILIVKN